MAIHMPRRSPLASLAVVLALVVPAAARAQRDSAVVSGAPRESTMAVGAHYRAGGLHRLFFGDGYRLLWTTPLPVPVLDFHALGGLTPTTAGGGQQTKSLRFDGGDGFRYGFRSVDKEPVIPPGLAELEGTFVQEIIRDGTSATHPGAPAVAAGLLTAAGVLHTEATLVVIPDDPALGRCRERFAGTIGYFERRAVVRPGRPGFGGALEIVGTDALMPRLLRGPADRVDARAFLAARLTDIFMGDWDRHRGQWGWARLDSQPPVRWQPVPEDRDNAFVRFNGLVLSMARRSYLPQMVNFGEHWAYMYGQTFNGRDIDRYFLPELGPAVWDSVAAALQQRLTDSAIAASVRRLPPVWYAADGERLTSALRWRRDHLAEAAHRFYRQLSREPDLHATNAAELVTIERQPGGRLAVSFALREPAGAEPYLSRTLDPRETHEVRVYLQGGADRVVVRGDGPDRITVRVIGGEGVEVVDSSRSGGVRRYAPPPDSLTLGPLEDAPEILFCLGPDRPPAAPVQRRDTIPPPRDWGSRTIPTTWLASQPDVGLFAGTGDIYTRYGFRKLPYASSWRWRAGYATAGATRVSLDGTVYRASSRVHTDVTALYSGIEVLRFHGIGNATRRDRPNAYYRVTQRRYTAAGSLVVPAGRRARLAFGPLVSFNDTKPRPGRIIADSLPYGTGDYGEVGLRGELKLDTRDVASVPTRGYSLTLGGSAFPGVWDVVTAFGEVHGEATAFVTARGALRTTLALRAGAKRVFGTYPFFEAAFIGDAATARLGAQNRFAGDAAAWGNVELRVRLGRIDLILPSDVGVFALGDAGRVFVSGETSNTWHTAAGGGLWIAPFRPDYVVSVAVARSAERTAVYFGAGFAY